MAQRKGQTGNPHGRPKGKPNKVTADIKARIKQFVENEFDNVVADFNGLDAKDKVTLFERLLAYAAPKLQSLDTHEQIRLEYLELERLLKASPDEAVQRIADKVMTLKELNR